MVNRLCQRLFFVYLFCMGFTSYCLAQLQDAEAIKASYFYNFSRFITWPEESLFAGENINLCVGSVTDPMRLQLDKVHGKRVGERKLEIIYMKKELATLGSLVDSGSLYSIPESAGTCHLLFVDAQMSKWFRKQYKKLPRHTLTISEGFHTEKSVIRLFEDNDKLYFEIDHELAKSKQLKISAQLLKLSKEKADL